MVKDYVKTTRVVLGDGENLWDKLQEPAPLLGYTEEELARNREILAFIAQTNDIWDLHCIPAGPLTVPSRQSWQAVVAFVRSHPARYRDQMAVARRAGRSDYKPEVVVDPTPAFWLPDERLPLLRCLFLPAEEARAAWRHWRLTHDLDALDEHSFTLMPAVYRRLVALGETDPRLPILKGLYRKTWFRNHVLQRHLLYALDALEHASVEVMAVKGVAALRFYDGDSGARPMLDTDFMIRHADVARAVDVLFADGWVPTPAATAADMKRHLVGRHHGWNFRREDGEIDLHWHLLPQDLSPHFDRVVWAHRERAVVWGRPIAVPNATEHLIQVFVHAAGHQLPPSSLWAADAGHILMRAGATIDWQRLVRTAIERRAILPVRDALVFLKRALDAPIPTTVIDALAAARVFDAERLEYAAGMLPPVQRSQLHHKARLHMRNARASAGPELERRAAVSLAALQARPIVLPVPGAATPARASNRVPDAPRAPVPRRGPAIWVTGGWRRDERRR